MQMLLTSQQERVCRKKSLVLMRGQELQKQTVFKAQQLFNHTVPTLVDSQSTLLVLCVRPGLYSSRGKATNCIPPIAWWIYNVYLVCCLIPATYYLACVSCWLHLFSPLFPQKKSDSKYGSSHSAMNTTSTKDFLFSICRTLDSISFSSPLHSIYFRTLFIYFPICQRVVQKVDETASGLPFM